MAQHACDNRMDQRAIRRRQTLCGGVERKLQWLTAPQDGIEQTQRCPSRGETGRRLACRLASGRMDGFGHGAP
jgi:hypothetical protein